MNLKTFFAYDPRDTDSTRLEKFLAYPDYTHTH